MVNKSVLIISKKLRFFLSAIPICSGVAEQASCLVNNSILIKIHILIKPPNTKFGIKLSP